MASHELLKESEEEIKGRILSRLCGRMSPDELFSPGRAQMDAAWDTEERLERERKAKILLEISLSISHHVLLLVNLYTPPLQQI